jgi:3,4-dihydroxy 2-butanone 4-phosphate synthase/GTP cyclohydrolase II
VAENTEDLKTVSKQDIERAMEDEQILSPIEDIIEDARNGKMFILIDDEDRENEGDLVIPAQMATPDAVNFMATHGRGLICLTLTRERTKQLGLPMMPQTHGQRLATNFTVSPKVSRRVFPHRTVPARLRWRLIHARPKLIS